MVEYRPLSPSDEDYRDWTVSYAFAPSRGPYDPEAETDDRLERMWSFGERRGLFDDELLATCAHHRFETRIRDTSVTMAGLSAVATPPTKRRSGHVAELIGHALREYREWGVPISSLYPFDQRFYERFGWKTGCRYEQVTVSPEGLSSVEPAADHTFHRVQPEAYHTIDDVYRRSLEGVTLATERTADWWKHYVFHTVSNRLYGCRIERDGTPVGYIIYDITDDDSTKLVAHDLGWVDFDALAAILRYCYNHDSQVSSVELTGYGLTQLLDIVDDRSAIECKVGASAMVRIVDVPTALASISYQVETDEQLILGITDDTAPWNDDRFAIDVTDGDATVSVSNAEPDATLDIGTLSQLYVGYRSVEEAWTHGQLECDSAGVRTELAELFPPTDTYLPERF